MSKNSHTPKESRKRKTPLPLANQLTNYFSNTLENKIQNEPKESVDKNSQPLKKQRRGKIDEGVASPHAESYPKITIFLKKDQSLYSISSQTTTEDTTHAEHIEAKPLNGKLKKNCSQGLLKFKKSPVKETPPKTQKKTMVEFYKKVEKAYVQEELSLFKILVNKINETLRRKFNPNKVERFFHTHMKQFLRNSPDHLWSDVYRPNLTSELVSDRYAKIIKFWLKKYFRDQKQKVYENKENSSSLSEMTELSIGVHSAEFERELKEMKITPEEQDLLRNMRYQSLLIIGKQGRGKLSLLQSVCNEMNLEPIEVCNSSNRSAFYLEQIYEATQSQNVFMNNDTKQANTQKPAESLHPIEDSINFDAPNTKANKANVIIVRDFDKPLEIDKGFQNKIVKLTETSKSPFILLCEKTPKKFKKLENLGLQGLESQIDHLYLEKFAIEDIALLFYTILTIEKNFSKVFKDFRYKTQAQCPDFSNSFKEDLKKTLESINPENLEILTCYDDILEVTRYFEGNLTRLISTFEFYKELIYENRLDELKKECFLATESTYRKKHDIFVRFEKDQFSKQLLDAYRDSRRKASLNFNCSVDYLSEINKLTKALDFFSEPEKESNPENETQQKEAAETIENLEAVVKRTEFLEKMATLDILETKILKNKIQPDWDNIEHIYGELENGKQTSTTTQKAHIIPLKSDNGWNQFELEEKTFCEIQKESFFNVNYMSHFMQNPSENKIFVNISPYDEDLIMKMILKLKKDMCKFFSDIPNSNCKELVDVNEFLVSLGNTVNVNYKGENLKGRLRNSKYVVNEEERGRIESNIYIKSMLSYEIKQIRRDIRANGKSNKAIDSESLFGTSSKDNDVDELIKTIMTFSCAFFNKKEFSDYHTKVLRDHE